MNNEQIRVLIIEDDEDDVLLAKTYLSEVANSDFSIFWESNMAEAKKRMMADHFDIFLIDYQLGSETGLDLIKYIQSKGILTPAILLTGHNNINVDLDASKYGASDYLLKSELSPSILDRSIRYARSQSRIIQQLDEKEKKYRSLFEQSIDPVFLASEDLIIKNINASFSLFFDVPMQSENSIALASLFAEQDDYEFFTNSLKDYKSVRDFEVILNTGSGIKKPCLLSGVFMPNQPSKFSSDQCVVQDLTARKLAESEMLIAERLSMTGKIARSLAHEIRNPLTNLNLALAQLRDEFPSDNVTVILYEDIIQRNAVRIEALISEILRASRPDHLELELHSVIDVIEGALALANDRLDLKKIEVLLDYSGSFSRILVDKNRLETALLNIFINAIESMAERVGRLTIRVFEQNKTISILISDNGRGIPANDLPRLFDPFFTSKPTGMGLGLTSTKNIINSLSANITVSSEVNVGTSFKLIFKLAE